jgi:hypothetical protein
MSDARTIWHDLEARQNSAVNRQRVGLLLAAFLLIAMCAAEIAFVRYVAAPETVNALTTIEGMPVGVE